VRGGFAESLRTLPPAPRGRRGNPPGRETLGQAPNGWCQGTSWRANTFTHLWCPRGKIRACARSEGDGSPAVRHTPPRPQQGRVSAQGRGDLHGRGFLLLFPAGAAAGKGTGGPRQCPPRRGSPLSPHPQLRGFRSMRGPTGSPGAVTAPAPTRVGGWGVKSKQRPVLGNRSGRGLLGRGEHRKWGSHVPRGWEKVAGVMDPVLPLPHAAFRGGEILPRRG